MDLHVLRTFKSLGPFVWTEIPHFVVLTGKNGSGKSQLLELIQRSAESKPARRRPGTTSEETAKLQGFDCGPGSAIRLLASWDRLIDVSPVGVADLQSDSERLWNAFEQWCRDDPATKVKREFHAVFLECVAKIGKSADKIERKELTKSLPMNVLDRTGEIFNSNFSNMCVRYHIRALQERAKQRSEAELRRVYGAPPWETLNDILLSAGLHFAVTDPSEHGVEDRFDCRMRDIHTRQEIKFSELSSGEQIIVSTVFWLFNERSPRIFPRLMLLDEPDAHLHPAMTKQFLEVLRETIVAMLGIRVVMTSHSPSTVALAPEESIFEMHRDGPRKVAREDAISTLSDGLIIVRPGIRWVLVEDRDDQTIFSELFEDLAGLGLVDGKIPLAFVSAGASATERTAGGRGIVLKMVSKLRECGLSEFSGLVDMDGEAPSVDGVAVLTRYSIENYLCDPLVAYWVLVDDGRPPPIDGVEIPFGKEHEMRSIPQGTIGAIVDHMREKVEAELGSLSADELVESRASYVNGVTCSLKGWQITRRGKDILPAFQRAFGSGVHPKTLRKALRRTGLVSVELRDAFCKLQQ